jgi:hypothetical protein
MGQKTFDFDSLERRLNPPREPPRARKRERTRKLESFIPGTFTCTSTSTFTWDKALDLSPRERQHFRDPANPSTIPTCLLSFEPKYRRRPFLS